MKKDVNAADMQYPSLEDLIRRAKLQRTAHVADIISTGLAAVANGAERAFDGIARAWRPKRKLAPR